MTTFTTTSKTIRLALALTVLTPVPLFAETLTARQMLAQAQSQAVTLPGESKKPTTTELAKLEVGKTDLVRTDLGKTDLGKTDLGKPEPVEAADLAPPLPIIAPPAPQQLASTASAEPAPQSRPANDSASATSTPNVAKPSIASVTVPTATVSAVAAPAPVAVVAPLVTLPAATPAPVMKQAAVTQPAPAAPINDAAPATLPTKTARHDTVAKAADKAPGEKLATRRPQGSRTEASFDGGGSSINARMISRIMQRPEVQSLIAQYGAR